MVGKSSQGKISCIISQLPLTVPFKKLIYFDSDRFYKVHSLFLAIEDAASGKTPFKHSENFIERLARVSSY